MPSHKDLTTITNRGHCKRHEELGHSIALCSSHRPFPLGTSKQRRIALDFLSKRIERNINMLQGKCPGGNLVYAIMDAPTTLQACERAQGTRVYLDKFRDVAARLGDSEKELAELKGMSERLERAVQEAQGQAGI